MCGAYLPRQFETLVMVRSHAILKRNHCAAAGFWNGLEKLKRTVRTRNFWSCSKDYDAIETREQLLHCYTFHFSKPNAKWHGDTESPCHFLLLYFMMNSWNWCHVVKHSWTADILQKHRWSSLYTYLHSYSMRFSIAYTYIHCALEYICSDKHTSLDVNMFAPRSQSSAHCTLFGTCWIPCSSVSVDWREGLGR